MGQAEVLKVLKKDKWMESIDIAKKLKQIPTLINRSLRRLLKEGLVFRSNVKDLRCIKYKWRLK